MDPGQSQSNHYLDAARLDHVAFWNPLPIPDNCSELARRLIRESDKNLKDRRLESALDLALAVNALQPSYVPGFVRTCELLIATQRGEHAGKMIRSVESLQLMQPTGEETLPLAKLSAHVDQSPANTQRVAWRILESGSESLLAPYVPAAIESLAEAGRSDDAIDLALSWVERAAKDPRAQAYLIREYLRTARTDDANQALRAYRSEYDVDRIWPENLVVSALIAISAPNGTANWRAAGSACQRLRDGSIQYASVDAVLEFLVPALPSTNRALILAGLMALNAGDPREAAKLLQTVGPDPGVDSYLVSAGLSRASAALEDVEARLTALRAAFEALGDPDVREFAESHELFGEPATLSTIGIEIARLLQRDESYPEALSILDRVRRSGAGDSEVDRLHAEIVGQSGSQREALQELERLLQQQETTRDYPAAIQTLESMLRLSPGNLSLRNRLVDKYLRIGRFQEAIDQLVTQARLLHKAGRGEDAEQPAQRAIEVATMTGEWETVSKLHRLMISFNPRDTRARHFAVATYVQHGRTSEALEQLRDIARIARSNNDLDEAIAASHQLLALNPDDPDAYHQLGELLISIGEYGQADRVYRRLAALVPDDPSVNAKRKAIAAMARNRQ